MCSLLNSRRRTDPLSSQYARLEALAQTMTSARGDDTVVAMRALLTELVKNQIDMHRHRAGSGRGV